MYYDMLRIEVPEKEEMFPALRDQIAVLDKYGFTYTDEIKNGPGKIQSMWAEYLLLLDEAEKLLNYYKVVLDKMNKCTQ